MRNKKHVAFIVFTLGLLIFTMVLSYVFKTDRIYTHLFYIPIALSAAQFPRLTLPLGILLSSIHLLAEYILRSKIELLTIVRAGIMILVTYSLSGIWQREKDFLIRMERLDYQRYHDGLTETYNRRYYENLDCKILSYPVGLLVCDVDGLKGINDQFGHLIGDGYIIETSKIVKKCLRSDDRIIRMGGDEFLVILEKCTPDFMDNLLKRIYSEIDNHHIHHNLSELFPVPISFSVGFALVDRVDDFEKALEKADKKMYQVKIEKKKQA